MSLEHIDPTIQQVISELKLKNPAIGDRYEQAVRDRAFRGRMRANPSSPQGADVTEAAGEIIRRLNIIDGWYEKCNELTVWNKVKTESPDLINKLLDLRDAIDKHFERWKDGSGKWVEVEGTILDYAGVWREIYKACK